LKQRCAYRLEGPPCRAPQLQEHGRGGLVGAGRLSELAALPGGRQAEHSKAQVVVWGGWVTGARAVPASPAVRSTPSTATTHGVVGTNTPCVTLALPNPNPHPHSNRNPNPYLYPNPNPPVVHVGGGPRGAAVGLCGSGLAVIGSCHLVNHLGVHAVQLQGQFGVGRCLGGGGGGREQQQGSAQDGSLRGDAAWVDG